MTLNKYVNRKKHMFICLTGTELQASDASVIHKEGTDREVKGDL